MIRDEDMGSMITKILKPEDLEYTFAIIMPDLDQPWDMMNQCEKWMKVLKDAVYSLSPKLELKKLDFLKERVIDSYKTYEEPEFDKEGKFVSKQIMKAPKLTEEQQKDGLDNNGFEEQEEIDDLRREMDLPEGTLVTNLFIPCAVVCSKVDLIEHGSKDIKDALEKNLDYIQVTLRKFCLSHGCSLIFASCNSNSNIGLIYDYIISKVYELEFPHKSNTSDKEALFIPIGYDSLDMIDGTADLTQFLNKVYSEMKANGENPEMM